MGSVFVRAVPLTRRWADTHAGVELHQLPIFRQHPRGDQRTVVVPARLHPHAHQRHLSRHDLADAGDEPPHPDPVQRELERPRQPPSAEVHHHRHRRGLAHIDRNGDEPIPASPPQIVTSAPALERHACAS